MRSLSFCTVGSSCIPEYRKRALAVVREAFSSRPFQYFQVSFPMQKGRLQFPTRNDMSFRALSYIMGDFFLFTKHMHV